jgi:hypothetical protein
MMTQQVELSLHSETIFNRNRKGRVLVLTNQKVSPLGLTFVLNRQLKLEGLVSKIIVPKSKHRNQQILLLQKVKFPPKLKMIQLLTLRSVLLGILHHQQFKRSYAFTTKRNTRKPKQRSQLKRNHHMLLLVLLMNR